MSSSDSERPKHAIPLSRREFMAIASGATAAFVGGFPFRTMAQTPLPPTPTSFAESPMLTEMVNAGTLPPLEERLPSEPLVVEGVDGVGNFGGTWRSAMVGGADFWFN